MYSAEYVRNMTVQAIENRVSSEIERVFQGIETAAKLGRFSTKASLQGSLTEIKEIVDTFRKNGYTVTYTNGLRSEFVMIEISWKEET